MAVNLKVHIVVDKKKNKVLFAEARKDFVDFIFHILALPLGAVASVLLVRDDLTVCASVATAAFSLLDEFSIKYVGAIEKREVTFGTDEAIKPIKASLSSETVLTDVFLAGGGST